MTQKEREEERKYAYYSLLYEHIQHNYPKKTFLKFKEKFEEFSVAFTKFCVYEVSDMKNY